MFHEFIEREELGELRPNQAEVSYVNHIFAGAGWEKLADIGKVFTVFGLQYSHDFLPEPEGGRFSLRYVIPDPEGHSPVGRLHIKMDPASRRVDLRPVLVLQLTARGRPLDDSIEGSLRFLDLGRKWIVHGFTAVTTQRMHSIWERRDGHQRG